MFSRKVPGMMAVAVLIILGVGLSAGAEEAKPYAVITSLGGGGASRVGGAAFSTGAPSQPMDYQLAAGETIVTTNGTAALLLPGYDTVIQLGDALAPAELRLDQFATAGKQIPLKVTVSRGQALVVQKPDDQDWLLVDFGTNGAPGHALSRGATFVVRAGTDDSTVAVTRGEVVGFAGPPGANLVDAQGQLLAKTGVVISPGERRSLRTLMTAIADTSSVPRAVQGMGDTLFRFGLDKGGQWIERAEEGDLIPARGAVRGAQRVLVAELAPRMVIPPRTGAAVTTPRTILAPSGAGTRPGLAGNAAIALASSQNPAEAVVGQRLVRTRIIGSPGTTAGAGIRFNPQTVQLIRLAGTSPIQTQDRSGRDYKLRRVVGGGKR